MIMVLLLVMLAVGVGAAADVTPFPVPDAAPDAPYTVVVGDVAVPVEKCGAVLPVYYARAVVSGAHRAEVTATASPGARFVLLPERLRANVSETPGRIAFDVIGRGPYAMTVWADGVELPSFILVVEDVADVRDAPAHERLYRLEPVGAGLDTARIQAALDACADAPDGGAVIFTPGIYTTGSVTVGPNTVVYFAPGALVRAASDRDLITDRGIFHFTRADNSRMYGHGVIDGHGHVLRLEQELSAQIIRASTSTNLVIEDVTLRNAPGWTFLIRGCRGVRVDNVKLFSDWAVANNDGINPESSEDVTITRYFGHGSDDTIAVKTLPGEGYWVNDGAARNITVRDSVVMCRKTALKAGTETNRDIENLLFENIDIIHSARGLGIWMRDGAAIRNVVFRDIRMHLREIDGEYMSGEPFRVVIQKRHGLGTIENIRYENITTNAPFRALIQGRADRRAGGLLFKDIVIDVSDRLIKRDPAPVFRIEHAENVRFENVTARWATDDREPWSGLFEIEDSDDIATGGAVLQ